MIKMSFYPTLCKALWVMGKKSNLDEGLQEQQTLSLSTGSKGWFHLNYEENIVLLASN